MTVTDRPEYRKLRLDSSNDLMRHDGRRAEGEYAQAALHARQAGLARQQMAAMAFAAGEYVRAASDWLSAAACFYLVPDLDRMTASLYAAQQVEREGRIPAENRHVYAALREREQQAHELHERLTQLGTEYERLTAAKDDVATLAALLGDVRRFPGLPALHVRIYYHADRLGKLDLARQHLDWTRTLAPESPLAAALLVGVMLQTGNPVGAAKIGREALAEHPNVGLLRVRVAEATAAAAGDRSAGLEEAVGILEPLVDGSAGSELDRFVATSLAATLRYDLGQEAEYRQLKTRVDQLAGAATSPTVAAMVARLRAVLPHIFPPPGTNGAAPVAPGAIGQASNRVRWGEAVAPMTQLAP